jgi:hypothetical protein
MFVYVPTLYLLVLINRCSNKLAVKFAISLTSHSYVHKLVAGAAQDFLHSPHAGLPTCEECQETILPKKRYKHFGCEFDMNLRLVEKYFDTHENSPADTVAMQDAELVEHIRQNYTDNSDDLAEMRDSLFAGAVDDDTPVSEYMLYDLGADFVDVVDTCPDHCHHAACHYDRTYRDDEFDFVRKSEPMRLRVWTEPQNSWQGKYRSRH